VLDLADAEFPFAAGGALRAARLGIAHGRAVARRDARAAERLGAELAALAPPDDATDLPLRCAAALAWRPLRWADRGAVWEPARSRAAPQSCHAVRAAPNAVTTRCGRCQHGGKTCAASQAAPPI